MHLRATSKIGAAAGQELAQAPKGIAVDQSLTHRFQAPAATPWPLVASLSQF